MPVQKCQSKGKSGYRWGTKGTCYTYTKNNEASRKAAKDSAAKQGRAIEASKNK